jgi:hypothetical protein
MSTSMKIVLIGDIFLSTKKRRPSQKGHDISCPVPSTATFSIAFDIL